MCIEKLELIWQCRSDEEIVSLCNFQDVVLLSTTRRLYKVSYDYVFNNYEFDGIETKKE